MATSRKTITTYRGTGTQKTFAFNFDYLQKSFIKVIVGVKTLTYGVDYTVVNKQVELAVAPDVDVLVILYRETSTGRLVSWEDASVLRASDMTVFEVQLLHIAEETQDKVQDAGLAIDPEDNVWDARFHRLKNLSDPTMPEDAITKGYLENIQGGYIQSMNTMKNDAVVTVGSIVATATDKAGVATQKAQEAATDAAQVAQSKNDTLAARDVAITKANEAASSATMADTKATLAVTSAGNAATSATTASTKAAEAAASAVSANNGSGYTKTDADGRYIRFAEFKTAGTYTFQPHYDPLSGGYPNHVFVTIFGAGGGGGCGGNCYPAMPSYTGTAASAGEATTVKYSSGDSIPTTVTLTVPGGAAGGKGGNATSTAQGAAGTAGATGGTAGKAGVAGSGTVQGGGPGGAGAGIKGRASGGWVTYGTGKAPSGAGGNGGLGIGNFVTYAGGGGGGGGTSAAVIIKEPIAVRYMVYPIEPTFTITIGGGGVGGAGGSTYSASYMEQGQDGGDGYVLIEW